MNRHPGRAIAGAIAALACWSGARASDAIASGPAKPPEPAPTFCYAFGSTREGAPTTYYTGVFEATGKQLMDVQTGFRTYLAETYGSKPDPRTPERDITCVGLPPHQEAQAKQQSDTYVANMRRGGGTVVETGWKYAVPPPPPLKKP